MFRFFKDFLLHRLRAKTRHGVHSPFVYKLVDEVIYDFKFQPPPSFPVLKNGSLPGSVRSRPRRIQQLLYRLINAYGPENSIFIESRPASDIHDRVTDYMAIADKHTLLIIDNIYANKHMKSSWEKIKLHEDITLTVDLFWIGLAFFKQGRLKEHFKIRF